MFRFILFALVVVYGSLVEAHRQHISWTTVEWNQETQNLEVVHRIHEHDAQLLLTWRLNKPADLTRLEDRALFALYVEDRFKLLVADNQVKTAVLKLLGAELENSYILVYQELKLDKPPSSLTLHASLLMDLFPKQINMVNVQVNGPVKTLKFETDDEAVDLKLI